jgi:hypothetical protein
MQKETIEGEYSTRVLDTSNFNAGTYVLQLETKDGKSEYAKLIIMH